MLTPKASYTSMSGTALPPVKNQSIPTVEPSETCVNYTPEVTYSDPELTPVERQPSFLKVSSEQSPSSCPAISKIPILTWKTASKGHLRRPSMVGSSITQPSQASVNVSVSKLSEGDQSVPKESKPASVTNINSRSIIEPSLTGQPKEKLPTESGEAYNIPVTTVRDDSNHPSNIEMGEKTKADNEHNLGDYLPCTEKKDCTEIGPNQETKVISRIDLAKILEPSSGDSCPRDDSVKNLKKSMHTHFKKIITIFLQLSQGINLHPSEEKYQLRSSETRQEFDIPEWQHKRPMHNVPTSHAKPNQNRLPLEKAEPKHGDVLTLLNQQIEAERKLGVPKFGTVGVGEHYISVHHHQLDGALLTGTLRLPSVVVLVPNLDGKYVATIPIQNMSDKTVVFKVLIQCCVLS